MSLRGRPIQAFLPELPACVRFFLTSLLGKFIAFFQHYPIVLASYQKLGEGKQPGKNNVYACI
jgi:hypothetical protein